MTHPSALNSRNPHVAAVRSAIRTFLSTTETTPHPTPCYLAVSGGPDSMALAALTIPLAHQRNQEIHALIVDHALQPNSHEVATTTAHRLHDLNIDKTHILKVTVTQEGGPEAAARTARYTALRAAAAGPVLLGHTRDDQAETVLLGLGRGSGPRSLAGMRPWDAPWGRPLLDVSREDTRETCAALGIPFWDDPHNVDPRFTRVRLRTEALPLLEDILQGGVAAALARTANQLREDNDLLDELAAEHDTTDTTELAALPGPIRRRVLRRWLLAAGVIGLTDEQLRRIEAFVTHWRGQGAVWLPGGFAVRRTDGKLSIDGHR